MNTRAMAVTAVLGAVSAALYFIGFNVPLVPSFLQMDVADLPALIAAFSMGPVSGLAVCLITWCTCWPPAPAEWGSFPTFCWGWPLCCPRG